MDGQGIPLEGGGRAVIEKVGAAEILYIDGGPNAGERTGSGYGVRLELGPAGGAPFREGLQAADIGVATFTVWKDRQFSYISTAGMAGRPIRNLVFTHSASSVKGSFEDDISGLMGKFHARVDFDLPVRR